MAYNHDGYRGQFAGTSPSDSKRNGRGTMITRPSNRQHSGGLVQDYWYYPKYGTPAQRLADEMGREEWLNNEPIRAKARVIRDSQVKTRHKGQQTPENAHYWDVVKSLLDTGMSLTEAKDNASHLCPRPVKSKGLIKR